MKVKPLLLAALLAVASCKSAAHRPSVGLMATPPPSGRVIGFDPSVVGLPGAIGDTVYDSAGIISWIKWGTSNTDWRPVPVSQFVTGDPSQAPGLKAPIGFVVTMTDGSASWIKKTSSDTGWVVNPIASIDGGSGGGIAPDGGVLAPLAGVGTVGSPLSIPAATPDAGGYLSATDKAKLNTITPSLDYFASLSGAATSITVSGLNGNADGGYWIDFCGQTAAVSPAGWQFEPNGLTTNLNGFSSDSKVGGASRTDWFFANSSIYGFASGTLFCVQGHMTARTGRVRQFQVEGFTNDANKETLKIVGQWGDTSTNLTSLALVSNQASGLTTGTYLRLTPDNSDK